MLTPAHDPLHAVARKHRLRTVVVVSRRPGESLPDSAIDAVGYDIILVKPLATAYSKIRLVKPDIVIMELSFDSV